MKMTLFQVGKQAVVPEFSKNQPDSFYMTLAGICCVNQDVIEVPDDKKVKFVHQDFVDVLLEAGRGVGKTESHDLILEIAVSRLESCFPLVILLNSHLMIMLGTT